MKLYCNPKIKGIIIILIAYRYPQYCAYYPAFHEGYLPCLQTSCHLERIQIETLPVSSHGIAFVPHQLVELHTPLVFEITDHVDSWRCLQHRHLSRLYFNNDNSQVLNTKCPNARYTNEMHNWNNLIDHKISAWWQLPEHSAPSGDHQSRA